MLLEDWNGYIESSCLVVIDYKSHVLHLHVLPTQFVPRRPTRHSESSTTMRYVRLGESGLRISAVGVGCLSFGNPKGRYKWVVEQAEVFTHPPTLLRFRFGFL